MSVCLHRYLLCMFCSLLLNPLYLACEVLSCLQLGLLLCLLHVRVCLLNNVLSHVGCSLLCCCDRLDCESRVYANVCDTVVLLLLLLQELLLCL